VLPLLIVFSDHPGFRQNILEPLFRTHYPIAPDEEHNKELLLNPTSAVFTSKYLMALLAFIMA